MLTNGQFHLFDPQLRIPVDLDRLDFGVLNTFLEEGPAYFDEVEALRASERAARRARGPRAPGAKRKKAGETLRERQPW